MLIVLAWILTQILCFANILKSDTFEEQFDEVYYFPSYDDFLIGEYNKFSFSGEGLDDTALKLNIYSKIESRTALRDSEALWEDGIVPFQLSEDFSAEEKSMIEDAIAQFNKDTCVSFIPKTNQTKFLEIEPGMGCSAVVGGKPSEPVQKLGKGCFQRGTLIHEMMHVLGFTHEQNRPDRDEFVKIIESNIQEDKRNQFKKNTPEQVQTFNFSYDYESIMHYGEKDFAIDKDKPTIVPLKKGVKIGQREGFSEIDIKKINTLYNCSKNDTGSPVKSRSRRSETGFPKEVIGRSRSDSPEDLLELIRPFLFLWKHFIVREEDFSKKFKSLGGSAIANVISRPTNMLETSTTSTTVIDGGTTGETTDSIKTESLIMTETTTKFSAGETTTNRKTEDVTTKGETTAISTTTGSESETTYAVSNKYTSKIKVTTGGGYSTTVSSNDITTTTAEGSSTQPTIASTTENLKDTTVTTKAGYSTESTTASTTENLNDITSMTTVENPTESTVASTTKNLNYIKATTAENPTESTIASTTKNLNYITATTAENPTESTIDSTTQNLNETTTADVTTEGETTVISTSTGSERETTNAITTKCASKTKVSKGRGYPTKSTIALTTESITITTTENPTESTFASTTENSNNLTVTTSGYPTKSTIAPTTEDITITTTGNPMESTFASTTEKSNDITITITDIQTMKYAMASNKESTMVTTTPTTSEEAMTTPVTTDNTVISTTGTLYPSTFLMTATKEETTAVADSTTATLTISTSDPVTDPQKPLYPSKTTSESGTATNTEQVTDNSVTTPTSKCNPFTKLLQKATTGMDDSSTMEDLNENMFPPDSRKHVINYHRITIIETVKFRTAVINTKKLWDGGIVPYIFSDKYDNVQVELLLDAMAEFHNQTCVKFVRRTKEITYIFIAPEDRCSSTIGVPKNGVNRVSINIDCFAKGTLIHEFMHVLGFVHEQTRPDRDRYVIIMFDNIIPRFRRNFRKYNSSEVQDLGVEYDYSSVMHYEAFDFAIDKSRPTIIALEPGVKLGQKEGFSEKDILKINKLYNCPIKKISQLGEESLSAIEEFKKYFSTTISRLFRNIQRTIKGFKPR